ncbi:MarR family winged helix-turn-helix transcriptional regulator [Microbacterium imperiale]|uniref:MarR family transcriptional regulator n=1 Tax=Microbacterium imperiale TaxID=33884 RepID=A0A9W6M3D8_9MICO|nr:MarR family transcriptional regulator [Microbacterium imperiale]MBP2422129.1 DNA-binding MarR family transcriptional regulator [Microbacterium imperiale]MDS0200288.1 MarR family transcriptional regulator [Microbacterium imperiale]BFE39451.1 MarR family transcriptional regulator [Microbacterium imperiale]GLJ79682.1 MarR family transcriptional regulator [Microbacterium imperiale]
MTDTATSTTTDPRASGLAPFELRYLVLAAQREGNRALSRQLAPLGLTSSQFEIVLVLDSYGPITLKELGGLIVCETGSPSRIVDTLVRRGFVERATHPTDRRAVALQLTAAGKALVPQLREIDRAVDDGAHTQLDPDDLAGLARALRHYLAGSEYGAVLDRRFGADRPTLQDGDS